MRVSYFSVKPTEEKLLQTALAEAEAQKDPLSVRGQLVPGGVCATCFLWWSPDGVVRRSRTLL